MPSTSEDFSNETSDRDVYLLVGPTDTHPPGDFHLVPPNDDPTHLKETRLVPANFATAIGLMSQREKI